MARKYDLALDMEMDRLLRANRLEPNLNPAGNETTTVLSIAISLKRIADSLDRRNKMERLAEEFHAMAIALSKREKPGTGEQYSLIELFEIVSDYFYRATGIRYMP